MERTYAEYAARQAMELLAIDSPTGFTARAADWVQRAFEELGYTARRTAKGGVLVDLGGRGEGLLLEAHADTLGGMVFSSFDSIPEDGSTPEVTMHGLHIQVESIVDHRVEKALVSKVEPEASKEDSPDKADPKEGEKADEGKDE